MASFEEYQNVLKALKKLNSGRPAFDPAERKSVSEQSDGFPTEEIIELYWESLQYTLHCAWNSRAFGYAWNNAMRIEAAIKPFGGRLEGASILEVGSGVHCPVGTSLMLLALGAQHCSAVEPGRLIPQAGHNTRILLSQISALFPHASGRLIDIVDVPVLSGGDIRKVSKSADLNFQNQPAEQFKPDRKFDIIHSNAVFEHVMKFDDATRDLAEMTASGGFHIHKIDFIDHRYYAKSNPPDLLRFGFLMQGQDDPHRTTNRLRIGHVIAAFERSGLKLQKVHEQWRFPFPASERSNLLPEFQKLSQEDIETTAATLVFRKQ